MTCVAFLRAINVGGRVVKMHRLRTLFVDEGFANVETFIASGNVVFDLPPAKKAPALERTIEAMLRNALGYEVSTFVRTVLGGAFANPVDGTVLLFRGSSPAAAEAFAKVVGDLAENPLPEQT